ncbi:MAG TPA: hypothetical protein VNA25_26290 [Phycisphaerae bacterium]|nr:hypothetical protein [Phycisphaerae bacterium]
MIAERLLPHFAYKFQVIDEGQLQKLLDQADLSLAGIADASPAPREPDQLVKLKMVHLLVTGTLSCYPDGSFCVTARLVDWRTGQIESSIGQVEARNWTQLMARMPSLASILVDGKPEARDAVSYWLNKAFARATSSADLQEPRRSMALMNICQLFARSGDYEPAFRAARAIRREPDRSAALAAVAASQYRSGLVSDGLATANEIPDVTCRVVAYCSIADHISSSANPTDESPKILDNAIGLARHREDQLRDEALVALVRSLCNFNRVQEAYAFATNMKPRRPKHEAGIIVLTHQLRTGRDKEAQQTLEWLVRDARQAALDVQVEMLCEIASVQLAEGDVNGSKQTMQSALAIASDIPAALGIMGETLSQMGDKDRSLEIFDLAVKAALARGEYRDITLFFLTWRIAKAGFDRLALDVTGHIEDANQREQAILRIAFSQLPRDAMATIRNMPGDSQFKSLAMLCLVMDQSVSFRADELVELTNALSVPTDEKQNAEFVEARAAALAAAKVRLREWDDAERSLAEIKSSWTLIRAYCGCADALLLDGLAVKTGVMD